MSHYSIKWLDTAKEDLKIIAEYVYNYSPSLSKTLINEIRKQVSSLQEHPRKYPEFERIPILRKMVVQKAVVFYSIREDIRCVEIFHIAYGGQNWNTLLE